MSIVTLSKNEFKSVVRDSVRKSVREVFGEEMMALRATLLPFISDKEQADIEKRYKAPSQKVAKTVAPSL